MIKVLIINNGFKPCGIQQWGERAVNILRNSTKYSFIYQEVNSENEIIETILKNSPDIILYNYHVYTLHFLTSNVLKQFKQIKHIAIIHEGYPYENDSIGFNYFIYLIKNINIRPEVRHKVFNTDARYLLEYTGIYPINKVPTIGSFGFGFSSKRFDYIVETVNKEFDIAEIRFQMSSPLYGDSFGYMTNDTIEKCRNKITKPEIKLYINREFVSDNELLEFLAGNDINCFFYDNSKTDAVAGSLDLALSVKRPIAVTKVPMFFHLYSLVSSICIEDLTLKEIISRDIEPLKPIYNKFSNENFILEFERILDSIERKI